MQIIGTLFFSLNLNFGTNSTTRFKTGNVIYKMKFPLFATERHTVIRTQLTIATYNKLHKIQVNRVAEPPRRLTGCSTPLAAVHSFLFTMQ